MAQQIAELDQRVAAGRPTYHQAQDLAGPPERATLVGPLGAVVGSDYTYIIDGEQYEGYMSYANDLQPGTAPAALIVHQWMGLGKMEKLRADEMASHGYIAFAVDMYGKGRRATTSAQAIQYMHEVTDHPDLLQQRARKGIDLLKGVPGTNASAIVANGYCFGGLVVLELARQAAPIAAAASFHGELGNLTTPKAGMGDIPIQVHHGARQLLHYATNLLPRMPY
jgi:dienelactone hydrolase